MGVPAYMATPRAAIACQVRAPRRRVSLRAAAAGQANGLQSSRGRGLRGVAAHQYARAAPRTIRRSDRRPFRSIQVRASRPDDSPMSTPGLTVRTVRRVATYPFMAESRSPSRDGPSGAVDVPSVPVPDWGRSEGASPFPSPLATNRCTFAAKFRWLSRQTNPTPTESRKSKRDGALDPWRRFELELLRLPRVPFVEPRPEGARRD